MPTKTGTALCRRPPGPGPARQPTGGQHRGIGPDARIEGADSARTYSNCHPEVRPLMRSSPRICRQILAPQKRPQACRAALMCCRAAVRAFLNAAWSRRWNEPLSSSFRIGGGRAGPPARIRTREPAAWACPATASPTSGDRGRPIAARANGRCGWTSARWRSRSAGCSRPACSAPTAAGWTSA